MCKVGKHIFLSCNDSRLSLTLCLSAFLINLILSLSNHIILNSTSQNYFHEFSEEISDMKLIPFKLTFTFTHSYSDNNKPSHKSNVLNFDKVNYRCHNFKGRLKPNEQKAKARTRALFFNLLV